MCTPPYILAPAGAYCWAGRVLGPYVLSYAPVSSVLQQPAGCSSCLRVRMTNDTDCGYQGT